MKKIVRPGNITVQGYHTPTPIFCSIEFENGKLSITGVIGPTRNGNARGGCGQIDSEFAHRDPADNGRGFSSPIPPEKITFAPGWDADTWYKFLDIWGEWHLNDMRPYCAHQKAAGWDKLASKEVTLYHFTLKHDVSAQKKAIESDAIECLRSGRTVTSSPELARILSLPYSITLPDQNAPEEYEPKRPLYDGDQRATETKTLGWLRPTQHPDGILTRPCPECGYKYGSERKRETVPQDVINFLMSLPVTDITPAWV